MKILISPSKTQNKKINNKNKEEQNLFFLNKTKELNKILLSASNQKEFNTWLEIKNDKLMNETIGDIKNYYNNEAYLACEFYDGLQFKNINYQSLNEVEKDLLNNNLIIISGFYGMVFLNSYIKPYRLMLGSKIKLDTHKNLYEYWFKIFNDKLLEINDDKLLINLASHEYSRLINYSLFKVINVDFKLWKSDKFVSLSTYSKQCRGAFLNQFVKSGLDITKLKSLDILGFKFNDSLSNEMNYIYTLKK